MITVFMYPFLVSLFVLMGIIYLSHRYELFMDDASHDKPQNYHQDSTPRAGGLGILAGLLLLILSPLGLKFLLPVTLAFVSGIFEDFHHSTPSGTLAVFTGAVTHPLPIVSSITNQLQVGCQIRKYSVCSAFCLARHMDYLPAGSSRRRGNNRNRPAVTGA